MLPLMKILAFAIFVGLEMADFGRKFDQYLGVFHMESYLLGLERKGFVFDFEEPHCKS
jgi:hypothetical protein